MLFDGLDLGLIAKHEEARLGSWEFGLRRVGPLMRPGLRRAKAIQQLEQQNDPVTDPPDAAQLPRRSREHCCQGTEPPHQLRSQRLNIVATQGATQEEFEELLIREGRARAGEQAIPQRVMSSSYRGPSLRHARSAGPC